VFAISICYTCDVKPLSFSAKIQIIGVNPYVLLSDKALQSLFVSAQKNKGPIPVKGKIDEYEFIQTLVKYAGKWRLYINTPMMQATGLRVGEVTKIELAYDSVPRVVGMHPEFEKALKKYPQAQNAFEKLPPSRQKEINRYLNNVKTKETLKKNIDKIIGHLLGKEVEYFVLLRNKK